MVVGDAHVFPGVLTPVLTQLFFPKQLTTFLTCFYRGERGKYARKKVHLNWGSNSQSPGGESNTLTTESPRLGYIKRVTCVRDSISYFTLTVTEYRFDATNYSELFVYCRYRSLYLVHLLSTYFILRKKLCAND